MEPLQNNSKQMDTALSLFRQHPFATLLINKGNGDMPQVCHLPFLYDEAQQCFYAHASAKNPIIEMINEGHNQAKVIFQGEHGYVSPTWSEHIRVPTWDYCVVHVTGHIEIIDDQNDKVQSMIEQVATNESQWQITELDDKMQEQMLKAIKVLRVNVDDMHYVYKMSQAKHVDAKAAIIENFTAKGDHAMVARYADVGGLRP